MGRYVLFLFPARSHKARADLIVKKSTLIRSQMGKGRQGVALVSGTNATEGIEVAALITDTDSAATSLSRKSSVTSASLISPIEQQINQSFVPSLLCVSLTGALQHLS